MSSSSYWRPPTDLRFRAPTRGFEKTTISIEFKYHPTQIASYRIKRGLIHILSGHVFELIATGISIDLHHNGKTSFYSNLMKMVDYYDLNYDFSCNSLSDSIVNRYIGIMKNKYVSYWNQTLQQSQKLSFYCTIKDDYSPSPYLVLTKKTLREKH